MNTLVPGFILVWGLLLGGAVRAQALERTGSPLGGFVIAMVLPRGEQDVEAGFRDYLRKRNIGVRYVSISFSGKAEDVPRLIGQVRQARPDLVYTWGTPTALALAGRVGSPLSSPRIHDIPIVFAEVTDPVGSRLVESLERPGRNVTGVTHVAPLTVQFNAMNAYRRIKKLGYISNPLEPNTGLVRTALGRLAAARGVEIVDEVVPLDLQGHPDASQIPKIIGRLAKRKLDFLYIPPSTFFAFTYRDAVTHAALINRVPTFCSTESIVREADCLFGLFSSGSNVGRLAAYKATQILVERKSPGDIAVQSPRAFSLLINMPVAKALDMYPPLSLLSIADVLEADR